MQRRREKRKQPPVTHDDRLWSRFRADQKILQEIGELASANMGPAGLEEFRAAMLQKPTDQPVVPIANVEGIGDVNGIRQAEIQWEDRIDNQKKVATGVDVHTLGVWTKVYLTKPQYRVDADDLSVGRFVSERAALGHFNADHRYRGLDQLFLGHAPATIAEKHYTATSRSALDDALGFLLQLCEQELIDRERRAAQRYCDHESTLRAVDRGARQPATHRRRAGPANAPLPHPRSDGRKLPS